MQDELGLEHTTNSAAAVELLGDALDEYLASTAATVPALEKVLEADPAMPIAVMFRAYLLKLAADPRFRQPIARCYKLVAARDDLDDREQRHLQALELWQQERMEETAAAFDAIAQDYPKDILALRIAHYLHFYSAGGSAMQTSLSVALPQWSTGDRYYGYLKGMESFALEESGQYQAAEASGREALDINPKDIWAAHAVTHVFQMQARFREGVTFISRLEPEWHGANNFVNHMYWHKALQHLGLGETEAALAIYDELLVKPLADDFYLDVCNAASLLWRLDLLDADTGDRWDQLIELSRPRVTDDELVFTTLHYLMAPAVRGDEETINTCLQHFRQWAATDTTQGRVAERVGEPMARAIQLLAQGQHREGAELLQNVRDHIHLIGGSHAQRALFTQLMEHYQAA